MTGNASEQARLERFILKTQSVPLGDHDLAVGQQEVSESE